MLTIHPGEFDLLDRTDSVPELSPFAALKGSLTLTMTPESLVRALIARLRAAEARTAWQPIETAPVGVFVYVAARPCAGVVEGIQDASDPGWWTAADGNGFRQQPTHWAPRLPPPRLPWLPPLPAAPEATP